MTQQPKHPRDEGQVREATADVKALLEYAATLGMKEVPTGSAPSTVRADPAKGQTIRPEPACPEQGRRVEARQKKSMSPAEKTAAMADLREEMGDCQRCKLHKSRTNLVFGVGNPDARLMFVGEGPGRDEDQQGEPFVGAAGQLLTKIIEAMGLKRGDVYIANIVKSRPPNNRNPEPDEVAACIPFLHRQIEIVAPDVIVCLGSVAAQNLLGTDAKITRLRGKLTEWRGIPVMPTYHPAFLLRNAEMKKPVWEDMKKVMEILKKER